MLAEDVWRSIPKLEDRRELAGRGRMMHERTPAVTSLNEKLVRLRFVPRNDG